MDDVGNFLREAREAASPRSPIIVKTYHGSHAEATERFQADLAKMVANSYVPIAQSWAPGQWGLGAFLVAVLLCFVLIGFLALVYMLIVRPEGSLTVTYERRAVADEKTCPKCAEQVRAAALVCRYCGHSFAPARAP
jgi:hypothetical protein